MSGALLGDRDSRMSSSTNLIDSIKDTNIYDNIKNIIHPSILPIVLICIISSIVGCTQVLAVMLTHITIDKTYKRLNFDKSTRALDLKNTA